MLKDSSLMLPGWTRDYYHFVLIYGFRKKTDLFYGHLGFTGSAPLRGDVLRQLWRGGHNWALAIRPGTDAESRPDNPEVASLSLGHVERGLALEERGDIKRALKDYKSAARQNPSSPVPFTNMGNAYLRFDRFRRAERAYRIAIDRDPAYPEALNNLACLFIQLERNIDEALDLAERALALEPPDRAYYLETLAQARTLAGDVDQARTTYQRALHEAVPDDDELRSRIELALHDLK
jgi:tetratricopeptide (TPR) repeat protein